MLLLAACQGKELWPEMSSHVAMSKAADIGKPTQSCDHRLAHERCIYIYGTPVGEKLGSPARYGYIRIGSHDILDEPLSPPAPTPDGAGG
jgi:hypothetical protein